MYLILLHFLVEADWLAPARTAEGRLNTGTALQFSTLG